MADGATKDAAEALDAKRSLLICSILDSWSM